MGVIRVGCHGCLDNVLRLAVRAAGHAGGGVLDVDIVDCIAAAHGDDEPGGIVGRIENVATVEVASCYGYCVGFRVEGVVIAIEVEELEGRIGVQMLALVTQDGGQNGEGRRQRGFSKGKWDDWLDTNVLTFEVSSISLKGTLAAYMFMVPFAFVPPLAKI